MAVCPTNKIDSNVTGLRYAWEECLKQLPASPVWYALEPNSYSDFGATINTVARNPINPSRSRKKGTVVGLEATGGFNQDLTLSNFADLAQGFMFANVRQRGSNTPMNLPAMSIVGVTGPANNEYSVSLRGAVSATITAGGTGHVVGDILTVTGGTAQESAQFKVASVSAGAVTAVTLQRAGRYSASPANPAATTSSGAGTGATLTITYANQTSFTAGQLVRAQNFTNSANNGFKTVVSQTNNLVKVNEALVAEAAPPSTALLETVGFQFPAAGAAIAMNGLLVRLTTGATDATTLGLILGEWIFIGGDASTNHFANNIGFARVSAIAAGYLEFDKVSWTPVAEAGTGLTIQIFFGNVIRNETDPALIVRKTMQLERTLGQDANGTMSEYLVGAVPNELTVNVAQEDKVTIDFGFVACDSEARTGLQGLKAGTRPTLVSTDAFNTSSDFSRIKLASVSAVDAAPTPLFAFATDMSLTVNNNVSANKAIGVLGAFDTTAGTFEVGGEITAYFASVAAVQAVRNNADITLDLIVVKNNAGLLMDIPLLALGNGRITIEQDQPVTVPLETMAAESKFGHTLLIQQFPYLPSLADL